MKKEQQTENKSMSWPALGKLLLKIAAIAAAAFIVFNFIMGLFIVHSNEMYPSVRDGDLCVTFRFTQMEYDRIVAYRQDGALHFGRIIGLPGDVIDMDNEGNYMLNGSYPFQEAYGKTYPSAQSAVTYPYTVPEGSVFVLCDDREHGTDSRTFGAIETKNLNGTVVLMLRRRSW